MGWEIIGRNLSAEDLTGLLGDGGAGGQFFRVERHVAAHGAHRSDGRNQFAIHFDFQGAGVSGQKTEAAPRRNLVGIARA